MARAAWGFRLLILLLLLLAGCRRAPESDNEPATAEASPAPTTADVAAPTRVVATATPEPRLKPTLGPDGETAVATKTPVPAETADPAQTGWTLLVYMTAEGDLAPLALEALNGMERSGIAEEANVLVQVDRGDAPAGLDPWTGARRYQIAGDDDSDVVNSPIVADLGVVNMGDPDTLADFIAWGRSDYPANHYALLFWGDGGGWSGIAFDAESDDALSLADLSGALDRAQRGAAAPFSLIGFDAGGMNQLDVYMTLGPFARYVVATAATLPPAGWDYATLLQALIESPQMSAVDLTQHAAAAAPAAHAVDMMQIPDLAEAFNALAITLGEDSEQTTATVADARLEAALDEPVVTVFGRSRGLIDLRRFADFLAEDSPTAAASYAAATLAEAVARMNVTTDVDGEAPSVYFPATAGAYAQPYDDVGLPSWRAFLQAYYMAVETSAFSPTVTAIQEVGETANVQEPAFLEFEVAGTELASLTILGARREEDGRLRVVDVAYPSPPDVAETSTWQDGVFYPHFVWDAIGAYLPTAEGGVYGLLQPVDRAGDVVAMAGRFRRADGSAAEEAALLFDASSRRLQGVWRYAAAEGGSTTRALLPGSGDSFQVYDVYLEADRSFSYDLGATVVFSDAVPLAYDVGPLPDGEYTLGLVGTTHGNASGEAFVDIAVANRDLVSGYRSYLDPYQGFQFLYPATWPEPRHDGRKVNSDDPDSQRHLTISLLPGAGEATAEELTARVLADFGAVDVLYEEQVFVEGQTGRLTAYGYAAEDGEHTGIFITFANADLDTGFVVDVDGLAEDEAETLAIANRLITSWQFRPLGVGLAPGRWRRVDAPPFDVAVPAGYRVRALDNGWQLFQDGASFVALRSDPARGAGRGAIVARWLEVATRGVAGFAAGETSVDLLGDQVWSRADFNYDGDDGPMAGLVMATIVNGNEIVAWAETPAGEMATRAPADFRVLIGDAVAHMQGRGGLLYAASFTNDGTWGTGTTNNAAGRISNGAYRLEVDAAEGFYWSLAGQRFGDGSYVVTARQTAGPLDSGYGMVLRAEGEQESFYLLEISGDGYVWIGRCDQGCAETVTLVGDGWFFSPAVHRGRDVANTLRVEASDANLAFYVNNVEVGRVAENTLLEGDIGLFVEALGEGGIVVAFDDFQVWAR